jgi:hypothetical protein
MMYKNENENENENESRETECESAERQTSKTTMKRCSDNEGLCWSLRGDVSGLTWVQAYDRGMACVATHYAYTRHRNIDWSTLIAQFRPAVVTAEGAGDRRAYYLAMRDLFGKTKDGHCDVEATSADMKALALGYRGT